jgi:hypothetical protein
LAVYTCYDMITDIRAGKPEGWHYFIVNCVPAIRHFLKHYRPGVTDLDGETERLMLRFREDPGSAIRTLEPTAEREFFFAMRQDVLRETPDSAQDPPGELSLEALSAALTDFTPLERQIVWFGGMGYDPDRIAHMLSMVSTTAEKVRERAEESLRGHCDNWSRGMMQAHGPVLGRLAAAGNPERRTANKQLLDLIDGRAGWNEKQEIDQLLQHSWTNVDHLCRLRETTQMGRELKPLPEEEAARFRDALGLAPRSKAPFWKRIFAGA